MARKSSPAGSDAVRTKVLIVGSGFAGIGMAIRLTQRGMEDYVVLESGADVGGTWRDNHYPGAACDVMSHLYSFSFEPNPKWTRMYAPQGEILAYMRHCVSKYGIAAKMRFDRRVTHARFDERRAEWTVNTANGETYVAKTVVSGTGGLSKPTLPQIDGIDTFEGKAFHSARWDHDYDFEGKTVAIVGTGASAIQIVPELAKRAKKLVVYQRTPPWIVPRLDRDISEREQSLFARVPATQRLYRDFIYWRAELSALGFVVNPKIMTLGERIARGHLARQVTDASLRAKLTPKYMIGCKRILISNDYYPAMARPNVELVPEAVTGLTRDSVVTVSGATQKVDAVVYCSGFQASESVSPFPIAGLDGRDLDASWTNGAEAYLGTSVSGFPNFFMIVGPNTGLGHSSMIFMIEAQIDHVLSCLDLIEAKRLRYVDVRADVQDRYNRELERRFEKTVWTTGCSSWYQTRSGKNTTLWPGFTWEFRLRAARVKESDYRLVADSTSVARPQGSAVVDAPELLN